MSFILTLFFSLTINSNPELVKDQYFTFYHEDKFYIVQKDYVYETLDGSMFNSWSHGVIFSHYDFNPLNTNEGVFLVSDGGGVVYCFKDMSIKRIDDSFEHRNKYNSYDFIIGSKIFSFGGYGLFDDNNMITQFDPVFKEWSENITKSKKPPKQRNSIGQVVDSVLYVGGGISKHVNKDLNLSKKNQNDFWQYDYGKKRWDYLGSANRIFSDLSNNEYYIKKLVKFGKNTLLITQANVYEIDIKDNKLIQYNEFNENVLFNVDQIIYNPFTKLFFLTNLNYENNTLDFLIVNRDKLLGKNTVSFKLYKNAYSCYFIAFILVFSITLILIFRRKNNKIDIINNNLSIIKNELSSQDFFILETLLKHHPDPVQFPALLSEYEPHLSYESRVKKLRLSMSNIDEVIRKYTKKRALIFSKNKNDKRIKQVSLSK
ncbi:MAG: hypothetical protein ACPH2N_06580 [Flavobacteriaceae bacterium]